MVEVVLHRPSADTVAARLLDSYERLHAPHLLDIEVADTLRRYALIGEISATHGRSLLDNLIDFPIRRYPHRDLLPRVWDLRRNFTVYDAGYGRSRNCSTLPCLRLIGG